MFIRDVQRIGGNRHRQNTLESAKVAYWTSGEGCRLVLPDCVDGILLLGLFRSNDIALLRHQPNQAPHQPAATVLDLPGLGVAAGAGLERLAVEGFGVEMARRYPHEWLDQVPAVVFACLRPGELRILLHPSVGLADGGAPHDVPAALVSPDLWLPNTPLWVQLSNDLRVVRVWRRQDQP